MARQIFVNGEAAVKVGTGSASALEDLGVSVDGVTIAINEYTDPIFTDSYGPSCAFDEQHFLQSADISMQLIFYDESVLSKIRSRVSGTDGQMGAAGTLWGGSGKYFRLLITSPVATRPYNFPYARLKEAFDTKIGTKRTVWNLRLAAFPYTGTAGATTGAVLFNAVIS